MSDVAPVKKSHNQKRYLFFLEQCFEKLIFSQVGLRATKDASEIYVYICNCVPRVLSQLPIQAELSGVMGD